MIHFALCKEQQHSQKQDFFLDYGVAETRSGFQAGWSDCVYSFSFFCSFCLLIWNFRIIFCTHESTLPYRSSAQFSCGEGVGVSSFALDILEPQTARR
jgi:hypothetical protein